jgi:hypothetical protein
MTCTIFQTTVSLTTCKVSTRAKPSPCTRDHKSPGTTFSGYLIEGLQGTHDHIAREGIQALRTIEGQNPHITGLLVQNIFLFPLSDLLVHAADPTA